MVRLNKIYTRTGDGGTAGLVDGSRVSKSSLRMTAIGEVDEANAAIGVAISAIGEGEIRANLLRIQNDMFDLGADVATPGEIEGALRIVASQVDRLEQEIDAMMRKAPSIPPGVATSAPRSNMSFWMRIRFARTSPSRSVEMATPMAALASSTSPMAVIRRLDLLTREPSTSPAVPPSPVRV